MQHAGLGDRLGPGRSDRVGQTPQPVAHHDAHIRHTAVAELGEHAQPELGALPAGRCPDPEDVALALHGDADGAVEGPVGDLAVTDLHMDRVDEHHRVDPIQRPDQPARHVLEHGVGDLADRLPRHLGAEHLDEMRLDLPGREPLRGEGDHHRVDALQAALTLADRLRLEGPGPVPGHVDGHRPDLCRHRLRAGPVAGVPAVMAIRGVLVIAKVLSHLDLEPRLEHPLGDVSQQTTRPDQGDTRDPSLLDELVGELPTGITHGVSRRRQHQRGLDRRGYRHLIVLTHCLSLPTRPRQGSSLSGQASYTVDPTVPLPGASSRAPFR